MSASGPTARRGSALRSSTGAPGASAARARSGPRPERTHRDAGLCVSIPSIHAKELRQHCLSFPGSAETFPFVAGTSVFKVAGKMFALSRLGESPLRISLKCEPEIAERLRQAHSAVIPGYHLNKRHWNTVTIDGSLPDPMIRDMIEDSYDLVVSRLPRARQRTLGWDADA